MREAIGWAALLLVAILALPACREPLKCPAPGQACGALCCPAPANGAASCDGAQCGFTCLAGFHQSGAACVTDAEVTSCGPSGADCTAALPAHASATCAGDPPACGFGCSGGYHRVGSGCVGNEVVTSCGPLGADCTVGLGANATATCDGTSCGYACAIGFHDCSGTCEAKTDLNTCGTSCGAPCTAPDNSTPTCDGTSCGFICSQSYHQVGSSCVENTDLSNCGLTEASAHDCNTEKPADSRATCGGAPPVCGFICDDGFCSSGGSCGSCGPAVACGSSFADAAFSCASIKTDCGATANTVYWVTEGQATPFQAYCDMNQRGGGWALCAAAAAGDPDSVYGRESVNPGSPTPDGRYSRDCVPALHALGGEVLVVVSGGGGPEGEWQHWKIIYASLEGVDDLSGHLAIQAVADSRSQLSGTTYHGFCNSNPPFSCPVANPTGYASHTGSVTHAFGIKAACSSCSGENSWYQEFISNRLAFYVRHQAARPMPDSKTQFCDPTTCPSSGQAGYGQDGSYVINKTSPLYARTYGSSSTVVLDLVTGLKWQNSPLGLYPWAEAKAYCDDGNSTGGFTDWRLPTRLELMSLADVGGGLDWYDTAFFTNSRSGHWTSTAEASNTSNAWIIDFGGTAVGTWNKGTSFWVRCVRGDLDPRPVYSLTATTAFDHRTGLTWQRTPGLTEYFWNAALAECESATLDGRTDWRVPTLKELLTIVDESASASPMIDAAVFPATPMADDHYWSSSPDALQAGDAWAVSFADGKAVRLQQAATDHHVRCVR